MTTLFRVNSLPGLEHLPATAFVRGNTEKPVGLPVPKADPKFRFREEVTMPIVRWLNAQSSDGLWINGPMGAGKSSTITQLHAWLNLPLIRQGGYRRLEWDSLLGRIDLQDGNTGFKLGPLALAQQAGATFLMEEIDRCDPSVTVALNPVLDGYGVSLADDGGTTIDVHSNFRFAATANTGGFGDFTGTHATANAADGALLDRFRKLEVTYARRDDEANVLRAYFPENTGITDELIMGSIEAANEIRSLFLGDPALAPAKKFLEPCDALSVTLSTRTLIRFWNIVLECQGTPGTLTRALDEALTACLRGHAEYERTAIHQIFGLHMPQIA